MNRAPTDVDGRFESRKHFSTREPGEARENLGFAAGWVYTTPSRAVFYIRANGFGDLRVLRLTKSSTYSVCTFPVLRGSSISNLIQTRMPCG